MTPSEWVASVHKADGGWSWDLAHEGRVVLVAGEPITNPARCAREAEEWRRRMASGQYVLNDQGQAVPR